MKKRIEISLAIIGLSVILISIFYCFYPLKKEPEDVIKILTFAAGFVFIIYKLLVGWLFINLTVKIDPERKSADANTDHLNLKLTLAKGNIDSLWLEDVQFRLSEMIMVNNEYIPNTICKIRPEGMKKTSPAADQDFKIMNLWDGAKLDYYVLSPNENATFSTYTTIETNKVILVEVIILGTRPFYGIEKKDRKPIQWRSSLVVLPTEESLARVSTTKPPSISSAIHT